MWSTGPDCFEQLLDLRGVGPRELRESAQGSGFEPGDGLGRDEVFPLLVGELGVVSQHFADYLEYNVLDRLHLRNLLGGRSSRDVACGLLHGRRVEPVLLDCFDDHSGCIGTEQSFDDDHLVLVEGVLLGLVLHDEREGFAEVVRHVDGCRGHYAQFGELLTVAGRHPGVQDAFREFPLVDCLGLVLLGGDDGRDGLVLLFGRANEATVCVEVLGEGEDRAFCLLGGFVCRSGLRFREHVGLLRLLGGSLLLGSGHGHLLLIGAYRQSGLSRDFRLYPLLASWTPVLNVFSWIRLKGDCRPPAADSTMITPEHYFTELKRVGFRIRTESRIRLPGDYWGTARRRTIAVYVASKNINGHLVAIDGDVHVVDDDVFVSAVVYLTSTLLQTAKPLIEVPTFSSVTEDELGEIFRFIQIAEGLGPCTDYELVNGGKLRR